MTTADVMEPSPGASPRGTARMAGLCYLLTFLTGGVALGAGGRLAVPGDAAATATNILAHETMFRVGLAAYLLNVVAYIAVTLLFYELFRPVSRRVSLLAAMFSLVGCAIQAAACVFQLATLVVLGPAPYLSVFKLEQLQALAMTFLRLHGQAFNLGLVFFGLYCLLIGYLVARSRFLPRILGVVMALAGLGWLSFLWPPLAVALSPYILAPGVVGEGSLTLWLLVRGVKWPR